MTRRLLTAAAALGFLAPVVATVARLAGGP